MSETIRERIQKILPAIDPELLMRLWDSGELIPRDEHEAALNTQRREP